MAALRILLLTFTSHFVIDFLSIRKVIIFSAIATDDRHPQRSRSIHQNAANCMTIRFRYIAQPRGYGKPTAHAHIMMFDALPVGRTACRVKPSSQYDASQRVRKNRTNFYSSVWVKTGARRHASVGNGSELASSELRVATRHIVN